MSCTWSPHPQAHATGLTLQHFCCVFQGPRIIPVPEERPSDEEDSGVDHLSDDDLELLQADHHALQFLHNLPKKDLDKAVSEPRKLKQSTASDAFQKQKTEILRKTLESTPMDREMTANSEEEDEDEDGETWERGPRRARSTVQGPAKAGPLPIKSLGGEVIADAARHAEAVAVPITEVARVEGVTVLDDLEEVLQKKAAEELRTKNAEREAAKRAAAAAKATKDAEEDSFGKDEEFGGVGATGAALRDLAEYYSIEQRREEARRAMAVAAQALLGDPENQVGKQMRLLLGLLKDADAHVARLAMLSLLTVMRDLIPGYRIRPPSEREQNGVVVSKEVRKLWDFEAALLKGYQQFLKALLEALNASRSGAAAPAHGRIASRCMASLLSSAPHFNYASDLLQAVVPNMASKDEQVRSHCCGAVAALLRSALQGSAEAGATAVEAVQLIADLVKRCKCVAPPEVVTCLLELDFPELTSAEDFEAAKTARKNKKKKKKGGKKRDDVDRAFLEAQAVTDRDTRRHQQSATLEALFEVFFRVMKTTTASGLISGDGGGGGGPLGAVRFAKRFPLLSPTMIGLSKFAHFISVEYFQDMMTALEKMLASHSLPPAHRLLCLRTASEILKGQGEALTIDRRTFFTHLYSALTHVALTPIDEEFVLMEEEDDEEAAGGEGAGGVPAMRAVSQSQTTQTHRQALDDPGNLTPSSMTIPHLLTNILESMILDSKLLDATRQASFAKRIASATTATSDTGAAIGLLCVLHRMIRRQPKLRGMLDNEAGGPSGFRTFKPDLEDPAEAGALAVPIWELSLLAHHYHPHVAQAAQDIAEMNVSTAKSAGGGGGGGSAVLPLGTLPTHLANQYSTAFGGFRPPPKAPVCDGGGGGGSGSGSSKQRHESKGRATQRKKLFDDISAEAVFLEHALASQNRGGGGVLMVGGKGDDDEGSAKHTQQQQQQQQQKQQLVVDGEDDALVGEALHRHFNLNKQFEKNKSLRREHALVTAKLRMFHERLILKEKNGMKLLRRGAWCGGEEQHRAAHE